jgi:hypothetical protein
VAFIVDLHDCGPIPKDALLHLRQMFTRTPAYLGTCVIVGANSYVQAIFNSTAKIYARLDKRPPIFFVQSLEEAHALISQNHQPETL